MFTAQGEKIPSYDPHLQHQTEGGKALLALLVGPIIGARPRYGTVKQVLIATAAGTITTAQAKKAILRLQQCRAMS